MKWKRLLSPRVMILAALFVVFCGFPLSCVGTLLLMSVLHTSIREKTIVVLPDTELAFEHSRIGTHPMLAEYDRQITYVANGVRGNTTPFTIDTAGGYPINCYLYESPTGPLVRLDDAVAEHLLDPAGQVTYLVVRPGGVPHIGLLTSPRPGYSYSNSPSPSGSYSVTIDGKGGFPMTDLTGDAMEVYFGRIDGGLFGMRFIPASEAPEIPITKMSDW
jgi:hypothetical protein